MNNYRYTKSYIVICTAYMNFCEHVCTHAYQAYKIVDCDVRRDTQTYMYVVIWRLYLNELCRPIRVQNFKYLNVERVIIRIKFPTICMYIVGL